MSDVWYERELRAYDSGVEVTHVGIDRLQVTISSSGYDRMLERIRELEAELEVVQQDDYDIGYETGHEEGCEEGWDEAKTVYEISDETSYWRRRDVERARRAAATSHPAGGSLPVVVVHPNQSSPPSG